MHSFQIKAYSWGKQTEKAKGNGREKKGKGRQLLTLLVVLCDVAVLVQSLLHATQCDGCQVSWVFQLQKPLQVCSRVAAPHVDALAVPGVQPAGKPSASLVSLKTLPCPSALLIHSEIASFHFNRQLLPCFWLLSGSMPFGSIEQTTQGWCIGNKLRCVLLN